MAEQAYAYVTLIPVAKGFQSAIAKELAGVEDIGKTTGKKTGELFGGSFEKAAKGLFGIVVAGATAAAATVGVALSKGFQRLQGIEEAQAKLVGLGNSTEDVATIMDNALSAVRGTAFGMAEAATIAASAVAAGIEPGQELAQYLQTTADAAYIAGAGLDEMGSILNKATTAGKAQNDVLGQLSDRGIPIYQMLADQAGVAANEIFDLASAGEISSEMLMTALSTNLGGAALESGDTVAGSFANMNAAIGRVGANLLSGAFPLFKDFFSGVIDALGPLEEVAKTLGADLGEQLAPAFQRVIDSLPKLLEALVPVVPMMGLLLQIFFDLAILALPLIMQGVELFVPILGGAVDLLGEMIGFIKDNIDVVGFFATVFGTVTAAVILYNTAIRIATAVQAAFTAVMAVNPIVLISIAIAALVAGIVYLATQTTFFQDAWKAMTEFASRAWEGFSRVFGDVMNAIGSFFTTIVTNIADSWNTTVEGVRGALGRLGNFFKTQFETIRDNIFEAVKNFGTMLVQAGKDLIQGLINGILSIGKKVKDAIGDLVGGAIDGAKKLLGINSPSKVFADMGQDIGQGLANGMEASKGKVKRASGRLSTAASGHISALNNMKQAIEDVSIVEQARDLYNKEQIATMGRSTRTLQDFVDGLTRQKTVAEAVNETTFTAVTAVTSLGGAYNSTTTAVKTATKAVEEIEETFEAITNIPSLLKETMDEVMDLTISDIRRMAKEVEGFYALLDNNGKLLRTYSGFGVENLVPTAAGGQLDVGKLTDSLNALQKAGYNNVAELAFGGSTQQALDKLLDQQTFINRETGRQTTVSGNLVGEALERVLGPGFEALPSLDKSVEELTDTIDSLNTQVANRGLTPFAKGGLVTAPTSALIGEAGPEVVIPLDRFESMMGMSGGKGKTVNYYAAPNQSIDSEQQLFQAMRRAKVVANW